MAVSGTISQIVFTTRQVIEHAYRRCRFPAQAITSEMIDIAQDMLYLMLSDWANNNIQLWCIQKLVLPMYEAQAQLPLPLGTVDILNANLRQMSFQTPLSKPATFASPYTVTFEPATQVTTVGITWSGNSVPLTFSSSQDGINWTVEGVDTPTAVAGQRSWSDVDGTPTAPYFSISSPSVALGSPLPFSAVTFANTPYEITIARLNRDDYVNLPNKTFQGRPLQYWYDRQRDVPFMTLWPVPNAAFAATNQITVWRKRYIMDVGTASQTLDIPQRWFEAVVANLADRLAGEVPNVPVDILPILSHRATLSLMKAQSEERDNSPIYWSPNISAYTR